MTWKLIMEFEILFAGWECDSNGSLWKNTEIGEYGVYTKGFRTNTTPTKFEFTGEKAIQFIEDRLQDYLDAVESHKRVLEIMRG